MASDNMLFIAAGQKLGVTSVSIHRYVSGMRYPTLPMVRRIEETFGWAITDQVRLIPDPGEYNQNYGMVLAEVLRENFQDIEDSGEMPVQETEKIPGDSRRFTSSGWTQSSVALQLNTRASTVNRYLKGGRYPETRTLLRIEELWGWPASEQIQLIPRNGYDTRYANAFRELLDRTYPAREDVTKITSENV